MAVTIRNLTPHAITLLRDDPEGEVRGYFGNPPAVREGRFSVVATFPPESKVARVSQHEERVGELEINGYTVPLVSTVFGEPYVVIRGPGGEELREPFPEPSEGVYLIVSLITAEAVRAHGRTTRDLLVPGDYIRDADGRVIGIRRFTVLI